MGRASEEAVPTAKAEGVREEILSKIRYMETILKQGISQGDMRVCMRVLEQMSTNLLGNEKNNRGEEKQNHE